MQQRSLEVTVISGEDLRLGRKPVSKDVSVVVKTDFGCGYRCTTKVADAEGSGIGPQWDEKLASLPLQWDNRGVIALEVKCRTQLGDERLVGAARVPLSDFLGGYAPENHLHFLSYRLRDSIGQRNGIINFSARVKAPGKGSEVGGPSGSGGVAVGIPVWSVKSHVSKQYEY
ncbi:BON1-associated protein 2-like [Punica granatum]|uniref:C2 domain-containing protein n=2 Tax=Punica granatum TaxID=22663 RepID=A0A218XUD8_PUNGR|nr:BON1-associated protein 2-like [Punica granatum]OWM88239.1 hypothetical protein CDL15_Pgr003651 [Punica granatum]PKI45395.1 hypothetical protein CRG98_034200 [Punica granatum]